MSDRIFKGSLAPRRYIVLDGLPNNPRARLTKGVRAHAFLPLDPPRSEVDTARGWVSVEDEDRTDLNEAALFFVASGSEHLRVTMRTDVLKVPPVEVKRRMKVRVAEMESAEGRTMSRREKRLLKEEVVRELRLRVFPRTSLADVVWDLTTGRVWLLSTSRKDNEAFTDLFAKSFGLRLEAENVVAWSRHGTTPGKLAALEPTREMWMGFPGVRMLSTGATGYQDDAGGHLEAEESGETPPDAAAAEQRDDLMFLAREFLTWLVFHAEVKGGDFADAESSFLLSFGGKLVLRSPAGLVTDLTMRGPSPVGSQDIHFAIAGGLAVKEADLRLELNDRAWSFTLATEFFDLKRVKLPELLTEESDDRVSERLALLGELDETVHRAFLQFLQLRVSRAWKDEVVPAIREWLVNGILAPQLADGGAA